MKQYKVEIEELLQRRITIDAENREEAIRIAKEKYRNEEIILNYNDFKDVNFRSVYCPCDSGTN